MRQQHACPHLRRQMMRVVCANGAVQVREQCLDCGENARGGGVNVPHREVADVAALPLLADNTPPPAQPGLFDGTGG